MVAIAAMSRLIGALPWFDVTQLTAVPTLLRLASRALQAASHESMFETRVTSVESVVTSLSSRSSSGLAFSGCSIRRSRTLASPWRSSSSLFSIAPAP